MLKQNVTITVDDQEKVSGILAVPDGFIPGRGTGVVIAHGAGNDMTNPLLVAFADGLAESGFVTLRFNFPYKEKGKKAPDPASKLYRTWRAVVEFLRNHKEAAPGNLVAAGKSMGGRIAAQMVAEGGLEADRLVFLGYPLHPPGRKDKLRDAPLLAVAVPMLFFAGTRDSLCDLELLNQVLDKVSAPWNLEVVQGGDHSFTVLKSLGIQQAEIEAGIIGKTVSWLR
jgi:predicted alpha/beta-hydrolase family hydrolase